MSTGYTTEQLQADFGQRWDIAPRKYLDPEPQLAAVLRGEPDFIPLARPGPAELRDCLREWEARVR